MIPVTAVSGFIIKGKPLMGMISVFMVHNSIVIYELFALHGILALTVLMFPW